MGKVTIKAKKITITDKISIVLECYEEAKKQAEAEFNNNPIDSRLLVTETKVKKGTLNKAKDLYSTNISNCEYGQKYVTLPLVQLNLIKKADEIYNLYNNAWIQHVEEIKRSGILSIGNLSAKDVEEEKVYSPHIVIYLICTRIFAFALSENEKLNGGLKQYHSLLKYFVEKLFNNGKCPLYKSTDKFDDVGIFLGCTHQQWIESLNAILDGAILKNLHKVALQNSENLLSGIQKVIMRQFIAYLNPQTKQANMGDGHYSRTFESIEAKIVKDAINKDQRKRALLLKEDTIYQRKNIVLASLRELKDSNFGKITILYELLEEADNRRIVVAEVQAFIETTGWMAILNDGVCFDNLNIYLQDYITKASKLLFIPENSHIISKNAGTGLIAFKATNLCEVAKEGIELSKNFRDLQDQTILDLIRDDVRGNLTSLNYRETLEQIKFIDISKFKMDGLQRRGTLEKKSSTLSGAGTTSTSTPPPVPSKDNRRKPSSINPSFTNTETSTSEDSKKKNGPAKKIVNKFGRNLSKINPSSSKKPSMSLVEEIEVIIEDAEEPNTAWSDDKSIPMYEFVSQPYDGKDKYKKPPVKDSLPKPPVKKDHLLFEEVSSEENALDKTAVWDNAFDAFNQKDTSTLGQILSGNGKFRDTFSKRAVYSKGLSLPLIDIQDEDKNTLLHHAVLNNDKESIEWLLYYGASVFTPNKDDMVPMELVVQSESERPIFLSLIEQAKIQARPHQQGIEDFNTLCQLSFELSGLLYLKLCEYNELVKKREASGYRQNVHKPVATFFNKEFTPQRNEAQVQAYRALAVAETKRNYEKLLKDLEKIKPSNNNEGTLHPMLGDVIKKGTNLFADKDIKKSYPTERAQYKASNQSNSNPSFFKAKPSYSELKKENQQPKKELKKENYKPSVYSEYEPKSQGRGFK